MHTVIKVSKKDSAKAWGILVRHSAGQGLPNHTFVISDKAVQALKAAGVKFKLLSTFGNIASGDGVLSGERI